MGKYHTVAQGECFSSLAHKFGFETYRALGEAVENAVLKKERSNPNVLKPGDIVYIPDVELKEVDAATEQTHHFVLKREKTMFRLIVRGEDEEPFAETRYELKVDKKIYQGTTDGAGKLEQEISAKARFGQLIIYPKDGEGNEIVGVIPLKFGDLDPVTEPSGVASRLSNLGLFAFENNGVVAEALKTAIAAKPDDDVYVQLLRERIDKIAPLFATSSDESVMTIGNSGELPKAETAFAGYWKVSKVLMQTILTSKTNRRVIESPKFCAPATSPSI